MENLIFLGPPGCGKGTQAAMFAKQLAFTKISTGDLLREIAKEDTAIAKQINLTLTNGNLVSDELVNQLIDNFYNNNSSYALKVILDGYPRSLLQAQELDKILAKHQTKVAQVFYFDLPEDILVKRIIGRYTCANCAAIYNKFFHQTMVDGECDLCGSNKFDYRTDDSEETVKNRLKIFKANTAALLDFYDLKLTQVDASKSAQQVFAQIESKITV